MASFPWQQHQESQLYYSQQPQQPLPQPPQPSSSFTLLAGIRQKRLAPHELIKMLYEPIHMEDSASNSSSLESFTTSCTTATDDSYSLSSLRKHNNHLDHPQHSNNNLTVINNNNNNNHSGNISSSNNSTSSHDGHSTKKRRSYHLLLREIRRLRAENDGLKQMVDTIKQDLRFERESRQISEQCHQKYYTESSDRQIELEVDVMDKEKEIEDLKERIIELESPVMSLSTTAAPTPSSTPILNNNNHHNRWGCFDFDLDDDLYCQPIMGESATPDPLSRLTTQESSSEEESENEERDNDDDDDDDDDDRVSDDDKFEQLAISYLHQAMISKLTSARANLELDDLMLKYDPSPAVVLRTLAKSFVVWVKNVVSNEDDHNTVKALANGVTEGFLNFWKAILEKHVHDDDDQEQFLNEAERILHRQEDKEKVTELIKNGLVDNFHRLLVMLYKYDIVDGEAITRWWHSVVENKDDQQQVACRLRGVTKSFTQWLEDESDNESDDSDDDDEDGESVFVDEEIDEFDHSSEEEDVYDEGAKMDLDMASDSDTVIDQHTIEDNKTLNRILEEDRQYCACQFEQENKDDDCITTSNDIGVHQKNVYDHNNNHNNNSIHHTNKSNNYNTTNAHSIQPPQQQSTSELSEIPCKCQPLYTTTTTTTLPSTTTSSSSSPSDLVEKKPKKSVRILL